jgi:uncharacterized repeat protein (TIGR02543 family)
MKEHTCTHLNLGCGNLKKRELGAGKALVLGSGVDKSLGANKKFDTNKNLGAGKGLGTYLKKFALASALLVIAPLAFAGCSLLKGGNKNLNGGETYVPTAQEEFLENIGRNNILNYRLCISGTVEYVEEDASNTDFEYSSTTDYEYTIERKNNLYYEREHIVTHNRQSYSDGGVSEYDSVQTTQRFYIVSGNVALRYGRLLHGADQSQEWSRYSDSQMNDVWNGQPIPEDFGYFNNHVSRFFSQYGGYLAGEYNQTNPSLVTVYDGAAATVTTTGEFNYIQTSLFNNRTLVGRAVVSANNAQFDDTLYNLSFDTSGASAAPEGQQIYWFQSDTSFVAPAVPTKPNMVFAGWYTTPESDNLVTFPLGLAAVKSMAAPSNGMTVYARFVPAAVTVSFNTDGGSNVANQILNYGDFATEPATPTKSGSVFLGWYTESTGGEVFNFATTQITGATTIYARWKEILLTDGGVLYITRHEMGATASNMTVWTTMGTNIGVIKLCDDGVFETDLNALFGSILTEYITAWEVTGTNEITFRITSPNDIVTTINGSTMTYEESGVKWRYTVSKLGCIGEQYTITYVGIDGCEAETVTAGEKFTRPSYNFGDLVDGVYFVGWYTAQTGGVEYNFDYATASVTLYARTQDTDPKLAYVGTWNLTGSAMTSPANMAETITGSIVITLDLDGTLTAVKSNDFNTSYGMGSLALINVGGAVQSQNVDSWTVLGTVLSLSNQDGGTDITFNIQSISATTMILTISGIGGTTSNARLTFTKQ